MYLQSVGVKPDSVVGLCMERSLEMMVGLFGILQAGGAYVPLDPGVSGGTAGVHVARQRGDDGADAGAGWRRRLRRWLEPETRLIGCRPATG